MDGQIWIDDGSRDEWMNESCSVIGGGLVSFGRPLERGE